MCAYVYIWMYISVWILCGLLINDEAIVYPLMWRWSYYHWCGADCGDFNTLRPRRNGRHFADNTFKCIFLNENVRISIKFSLKFVSKGPINNISALVQIMAWRRSGDMPLSEPMTVSLLTHICVTRPQWAHLKQYSFWMAIFSSGLKKLYSGCCSQKKRHTNHTIISFCPQSLFAWHCFNIFWKHTFLNPKRHTRFQYLF